MKKFRPLFLLLITCGVMSSNSTFAQVKCDLLQVSNADAAARSANMRHDLSRSWILFHLQSQ